MNGVLIHAPLAWTKLTTYMRAALAKGRFTAQVSSRLLRLCLLRLVSQLMKAYF